MFCSPEAGHLITASPPMLCDVVRLHRFLFVCLPDCKPEGPLFSAEFVCVCVSDRHFYPSTLTDFDETWSQGPYSDLVWPRP